MAEATESSGAHTVPDAAAPTRWLSTHGDVLWRFAMSRVRDPQLAEDLIQDALVGALKAWPTFRQESTERTWLLSILRHKIADHRRCVSRSPGAQARAQPAVDVLDTMFDHRGRWKIDPGKWPRDADRTLDEPKFWADFERCISRLPGGLAEAFILREMRHQPAEAICAALAITAQNLWVRLHRARLLLRQCLAARWEREDRR